MVVMLPSPKVTESPFMNSNFLNQLLSIDICLEQSLSEYHKFLFIVFS